MQALAEDLKKNIDSLKPLTVDNFEKPKSRSHGDLALPIFALAKQQQKPPPVLAKELVTQVQGLSLPYVKDVTAVHGFVNFHFQTEFLQQHLAAAMQAGPDKIGESTRAKGQTMVIDFSSPNVAKPMSIGHLRATVIGQAIYNLAVTQGYRVIGINHLGDWGVQFGKLAWAYQTWGHEYPFDKEPFQSLYALYVRFHEAAEADPQLDEEGAKVFRQLESGDPKIVEIWKRFIEMSMLEYHRIYKLMNIHHDLIQGESFYNSRLKGVEALLTAKHLLVESDGAMVVRLDEEGMPPSLIRKSDGASLYATRDLASAIYRRDELKADLSLYVVGVDQTLHFRQVFKVLEKMGYPWAKNCHHIAFGLYKFKDIGKMSTRRGNVIFLNDVLERAIQMVRDIIQEKNPDLENKELVAQQVGVGAIVFNDLMNDRVKNVDFDWERVLDFEGDSGPFVQYTYVRCMSLLRKYGRDVSWSGLPTFSSAEERDLLLDLLNLDQVLQSAFESFKPHILANYLLEVAKNFNRFYHSQRILDDTDKVPARMALVQATAAVLKKGLAVLNMAAPQAM
jgi:arginyl-tRNA synthetase